jgi:hypothetical protein
MLLPLVLGIGMSSSSHHQDRRVFNPEGHLVGEGRVFSVASSDFDGDGRADLVVADYMNPARILYNDDAHPFKRVVSLAAGPETATSGHGVALADFNGDGHVDLFLVYNRSPARLLLGDGRGGFTDGGRGIGSPDLSGTSVAVADVDQDGDPDALVTYYQERARLYVNDGTGAFALSEQTFFAGIALGDIDGDGDVDVISLRAGGAGFYLDQHQGPFHPPGSDCW